MVVFLFQRRPIRPRAVGFGTREQYARVIEAGKPFSTPQWIGGAVQDLAEFTATLMVAKRLGVRGRAKRSHRFGLSTPAFLRLPGNEFLLYKTGVEFFNRALDT